MDSNRRFSFMRLVNNAIPNFARDDKDDVDLSPLYADALVRYQLSLPNPPYLSPLSFKNAGLTPSDSISKKIFSSLLKHGIVAAAPGSNPSSRKNSAVESNYLQKAANFSQGESGRTVFTEKIGRDFANQLAVISVHAQRKLVGVLFFWEEECKRWALLGEEEAEIVKAMNLESEGNGLPDYEGRDSLPGGSEADRVIGVAANGRRGSVRHQLDIALEAVRIKRGLVPSARAEATANVTKGVGLETLPSYS